MNTLDHITALKGKIATVPAPIKSAFVSGENLRNYVSRCEAQLIFDLSASHGADPTNTADKFTDILGISRSEFYTEFVTIKSLWESFRESAEYLAAVAVIQPLLDQLAALESEVAAENANRENARIALAEAEESALEAARKAALESPAVAKARAALAAIDAPSLKKARTAHDEIGEVS